MDIDYAKNYIRKTLEKCGGASIMVAYSRNMITIGELENLREAEIALNIESAIRLEATYIPYAMLKA